jgi:Protein of unknown function (DUF4058)
MDPFLEQNPIFQELHTQMLAEAQAQLQGQLRPKYVARLERHLSEGGAWNLEVSLSSLEGKEPDITIASGHPGQSTEASTAVLATPTASAVQELTAEELALRKQRRIVIYVQARPRIAVAAIELLSPSNKDARSYNQARYLEKRSSALHGGLHWVEIDLLRGGERPPTFLSLPGPADYLAYIAQARADGWKHCAFAWSLREPLPSLPIPLLGADQVSLDLGACFRAAYDRIAADDEVDYRAEPPPPPLKSEDRAWVEDLLRSQGLRP